MGDALAPWHIILLVVVILVLFGAKRLPGAAKSLGQSMHIFKDSVQGHDVNIDGETSRPSPQANGMNLVPPSLTPAPPAQTHDEQLAALQRQVADLQRQNATAGGQSASVPQTPSSTQSF
jgi:sec-independent protein translocase protein TatA